MYSADGRKLRTKHKTHPILQMQNAAASTTAAGDIGIIGPPSLANYSDSTEYIDNLILENRGPSKFLFEGGYASLSSSGGVTGWHYYIRDYMGNVRMVVNENGTTEQETYYYPYGGVIGDISTNQNLQKYKFEGKELDRRYGLDWYDILARQYDAIGVPAWNKPDPLAEKNPHLSPYVFAGGNPVNIGDYDGKVPQLLVPIIAGLGGAAIGAATGAAITWAKGGTIEEIKGAASGGAVAGFATGITLGSGGVLSGSNLVTHLAIGGLSNGLGEATSIAVTQELQKEEVSFKNEDWESIATAGTIGAFVGAIGKGLTSTNQSINKATNIIQQEIQETENTSIKSFMRKMNVQGSLQTRAEAAITEQQNTLKDLHMQKITLDILDIGTKVADKVNGAAGTYYVDWQKKDK